MAEIELAIPEDEDGSTSNSIMAVPTETVTSNEKDSNVELAVPEDDPEYFDAELLNPDAKEETKMRGGEIYNAVRENIMGAENQLFSNVGGRLIENMSPEDQAKIAGIKQTGLDRYDDLLLNEENKIKNQKIVDEAKAKGNINFLTHEEAIIKRVTEDREPAIEYVNHMMERYGIPKNEAFLRILTSPMATQFPDSPIVLYAAGEPIEKIAVEEARNAAEFNFGQDAMDRKETKAVMALTSPNLVTRGIANLLYNYGQNFEAINLVTEVDSYFDPFTWVFNTPKNLMNLQENISKRDWYEVTEEEHDQLLDIDSVQISKEDYKDARKDPEKAMNALTEDVVNEDGITETQYFYAPNAENLKYDKEKKGWYYRSQEFEGLSAAGNLALTVVDVLPMATIYRAAKKSFKITRETTNRYSKQALQRVEDTKAKLKIRVNNKKIADENWEDRQRHIEEFEERNSILAGRPIVIHTVVDGKKVIDPVKIREAGLEIGQIHHDKNLITKVKEHMKLNEADMTLSDLASPIDELTIPTLKAEKLDALVAIGVALRKSDPKFFAKSDEVMANGRKKTLIDQLFEYTLEEKIERTDDFINVLADYGMNMDEFILVAIGNGSEAGRLMQKIGQIRGRQLGNTTKEAKIENKKFEKGFKKFWSDWFLRTENVMRGALVTPLATAMRNASSVGIRMPAETLVNVMEEAVYAFYQGARGSDAFGLAPYKGVYEAGKKLNPLSDNSAWKNSFADVTATANYFDTERTMKYISDHPELANLDDTLFGAVAELRKAMGRGQHTNPVANAADLALTKAEDTVEFLNGFNKFQEFAVRRGVFLGQMRRLLKNEWNLDLDDQMFNKGNFQRILQDASVAADNTTKLRPDGARSIMAIIEDSTYKALDVTYAKQPDFFLFRDVSRFISRTGLTALPGLTFPRFMFNGLELMAKSTAGSTMPALRMITGNVRSASDVRGVGENMVGWAAIYAMYKVVTAKEDDEGYIGEQPEDIKMMNLGGENPVNIQGNFPLMQFKYTAQALKAVENGTFSLFDPTLEKATEAFLGDAFRSGNNSMFIKDLRDMLITTENIENKRRASEIFGKAIGQWGSRLFTPAFQISDAQRVVGLKPLVYKDALSPITKEQTLGGNIKRSFFQRWGSVEEKDYIDRVNIFKERGVENKRIGLGKKLIFGVGFDQGDGEEGNYLRGLGKDQYDFSSKLRDTAARNYQDEFIQRVLPLYVSLAQRMEEIDNKQYEKRNNTYKSKYSKTLSGKLAALEFIKSNMETFTNSLTNLSKPQAGILGSTIIDYRNQPKAQRKKGLRMWFTQFDREPDYRSVSDIQTLMSLGKIK